jgi:hypothetical protein
MSSPATQQPTPQLFFRTINSYQRTEALKAAIELEIFTAIGEGNSAVPEIAKRCQTSERGMRIILLRLLVHYGVSCERWQALQFDSRIRRVS